MGVRRNQIHLVPAVSPPCSPSLSDLSLEALHQTWILFSLFNFQRFRNCSLRPHQRVRRCLYCCFTAFGVALVKSISFLMTVTVVGVAVCFVILVVDVAIFYVVSIFPFLLIVVVDVTIIHVVGKSSFLSLIMVDFAVFISTIIASFVPTVFINVVLANAVGMVLIHVICLVDVFIVTLFGMDVLHVQVVFIDIFIVLLWSLVDWNKQAAVFPVLFRVHLYWFSFMMIWTVYLFVPLLSAFKLLLAVRYQESLDLEMSNDEIFMICF